MTKNAAYMAKVRARVARRALLNATVPVTTDASERLARSIAEAARRPAYKSRWSMVVPISSNPIFLRDLDLLHLRCKVIMASQAKPRGPQRPGF